MHSMFLCTYILEFSVLACTRSGITRIHVPGRVMEGVDPIPAALHALMGERHYYNVPRRVLEGVIFSQLVHYL